MAWRHISTVALVGTILVAAALLATAHPTAVIPALPVGAPAPTPMANARPDSSVDPGTGMATTLRAASRRYTPADFANAKRGCTKNVPLCLRLVLKAGVLHGASVCLTCYDSCKLAARIGEQSGSSVSERIRFVESTRDCVGKMWQHAGSTDV